MAKVDKPIVWAKKIVQLMLHFRYTKIDKKIITCEQKTLDCDKLDCKN